MAQRRSSTVAGPTSNNSGQTMSFSRYSRGPKRNWSTPQGCKSAVVCAIPVARSPGFFSFMDDIDRIVARDYEPSDKDVVKARLRTVGVQEYHFTIPGGGYSTFDAGAGPRLTISSHGARRLDLIRRRWFKGICKPHLSPRLHILTRVTWPGDSEMHGVPTLTVSTLSFF